jgi:hypothetical protein
VDRNRRTGGNKREALELQDKGTPKSTCGAELDCLDLVKLTAMFPESLSLWDSALQLTKRVAQVKFGKWN